MSRSPLISLITTATCRYYKTCYFLHLVMQSADQEERASLLTVNVFCTWLFLTVPWVGQWCVSIFHVTPVDDLD